MKKILMIITVGWWLGIGVVVLNHNLAPLGQITLRWNNPSRPTAHYAWHQVPKLVNGRVALQSQASQKFSVTLPRGFLTGEIAVNFHGQPSNQELQVSADAVAGKTVSFTSPAVAFRDLDLSELAFRGRTATFQLTNQSPEAMFIDWIQFTVRR